jgi:ABC-type multidrug transport system fused ATPase/permease subunit
LFSLYFVIIGIITGVATFFQVSRSITVILAPKLRVTVFVQMYFFAIAGEKLTKRIRGNMFRAILSQEMAWFDRKDNGVGALCAKLSGEAASVQGVSNCSFLR